MSDSLSPLNGERVGVRGKYLKIKRLLVLTHYTIARRVAINFGLRHQHKLAYFFFNASFVSACNSSNSCWISAFTFLSIRSMNNIPFK